MGLYRLHLYWGGRTDGLARMGDQLWTFVTDARKAAPGLAELRWVTHRSEELRPLRNAVDATVALEDGVVRWRTGEVEQVSYRARVVLAREYDPPFEFRITCGISPLPIADVFAPNKLECAIRGTPGDGAINPGTLALLLRAGVTALQPDWGYVGSESVPQTPMAIFSEANPRVGWMTYLGPQYRVNQSPMPPPAVVSVLDGNGVVITSQPAVFDEDNAEHRANLLAVEGALNAAGVATSR